ncbi:MAG TPA: class I SAM-dependent methyltransferase [Methylibium sp.]|uniref:O-methyltransferase n=1 Tax=Methylibium sp. TaxID=2067992 RepID=UPI002DBC94A5|nr:class I SAM-dependent methyltransferase [Methylibium sp.]HEU4457660.1 class I SAM-dependent methyltransferase [Methylibium sp.]
MFEHLLSALPEAARACRALYDLPTGGYHLPPRHEHRPLSMDDVPACRQQYTRVQFDCVEVPVADLLYTLVVNTASRRLLETGTSRGFSTCHLAAGARFDGGEAAQLVTIDPQPTAHPMFEGSALAGSIQPLHADSLQLDPRALVAQGEFDFMFFDSLHTYAHLSAELALYLPALKLGGLFMLHDTLVYDDLGLVVLAASASRALEVVSLATHRRHDEPSRRPGVSVFRKIAPIAPGALRFPDLGGIVEGERKCVRQPAAIIDRSGMVFTDARYTAHRLHRDGARSDWSPALLEPAAD